MKHLIIGLTGLIGSGKSKVAEIFANLGTEIIDTDAISHSLTNCGGGAIALIKDSFGDEYIDANGCLNRDKMRNLVFNNVQAKDKLESILHGLIFAEVLNQLTHTKNKLVIIVVPLLFKAPKYLELIDYSVFVDCKKDILCERVKQRSGLSQEIIENIMLSQVPRDTQIKSASDVIENNGSIEELTFKVKQLYIKYNKENT